MTTNQYPLGLSFAEWIPIDKIGLEVPGTTIPPAIIPLRNQLTVTYLESIYYQSMTPGVTNSTFARFYPNGPGYLDSKLLDSISSISNIASSNLKVLTDKNKDARADQCWSEPDESCELWVVEMKKDLQNYEKELGRLKCLEYDYLYGVPYTENDKTGSVEFSYFNNGQCDGSQ